MTVKSGRLEPLKLFKVFRSLAERRLTGVLTVRRGSVVKQAQIVGGQPYRSASNVQSEGLLWGLVEEGLLSSTEKLQVEARAAAEQVRAEALLVSLDLVAANRLVSVERRLSRRRLAEAFGWADGDFTFEPREIAAPRDVPPIDPVHLMIEAAARYLPAALPARFIKLYPGQLVCTSPLLTDHGQHYDRYYPPPNVRRLLQTPQDVEALVRLHGDPEDVARQVFTLVVSGLCHFDTSEAVAAGSRAGAQAPPPPPPHRSPPPPPPPAPPVAKPPPPSSGFSQPPLPPSGFSQPPPGASAEASVFSMPPAPAAFVPRSAPVVGAVPAAQMPPRSATGSMPLARPPNTSGAMPQVPAQVHTSVPPPVAMRGQATAAPGESPRASAAATAPVSRPAAVRPANAGRMASPTTGERPRADLGTSGTSPRVEMSGSGGLISGGAAPTARPPVSARAAPQRAQVPAEVAARLEQARTMFRSLETATHYTVLGLARSATPDQIRLSFRQLAGLFHSDRFVRFALADTDRAVVQKVFIAVNKASEVLSDPERRREYDLGLDAGSKGGAPVSAASQIDQVFKAEKLVRDAVMLLRNNQGAAALEKADEALVITPKDPLAQAARHFADFLVVQARGSAPQMAARTRDALRNLTAEFQARDEPFVYLGRVHRHLGENEAAIAAFEMALKANPRCAEAASELRFLQRHTTKSEPTRGGDSSRTGGLFGLRKK